MYDILKSLQGAAEALGKIRSASTKEETNYSDPGVIFTGIATNGKLFILEYSEKMGEASEC